MKLKMVLAGFVLIWSGHSFAETADFILDATGAGRLIENKLELDAPELAENGTNVPIGIKNIHLEASNIQVKQIWIFDQQRKRLLASFVLSAETDAKEIKTRVKLANTTVLYAVAKLSDGTRISGQSQVKVTRGGC